MKHLTQDKMLDREPVCEESHRQDKSRNHKQKAKIAPLFLISVCVMVAIAVFVIGKSGINKTPQAGNAKPAVQATILFSLNPEIEFQVDEEAMIISVIGTNEDGAKLIEGIDFTGFSFENATVIVVNKLIEKNYISVSSIEKSIFLSVSGDTDSAWLLEVMSETIKAAASKYELAIDTMQTDEKQLEIILVNAQEDYQHDEGLGYDMLPDADWQDSPGYMEIEYKLNG